MKLQILALFLISLCLAEDEYVINTSFDDESALSFFAPRGDSVELVIMTDGGNTGTNYLKVTNRKSSWNGLLIPLDDICIVGREYIVSYAVKTQWWGNVVLSMQYTDTAGTEHYNNLKTVVSQGSWVKFEEYKFSMPMGVTNVAIYLECSDVGLDINVDDFVLKLAPEKEIQEDLPSLKDVYAKYFKFGTATTVAELGPKPTQKLILKHFNSMTLGNELKPDAILDKTATLKLAEKTGDYNTPVISLGQAKVILDFCNENKIPVRGHTLVWHSQTPTWFFKEKWDANNDWVDKDTMLIRMENYIKTVFEVVGEEYPDIDFYAWDVVNEAWLDDGNTRIAGANDDYSGKSPWVKVFGDNSFIKYAFQYAKKYAFKNCKLYYNDYNEYITGKTNAILNMVKEINAEEKLIDGIGLQSHLDVGFPSISVYEKALKLFVETGLDIQVTELDVTISGNTAANLKTQATYYSNLFDVLVKYADNISAVVVWGTIDSTSWRAAKYPLLFNEDYTAKECFDSIVDGLE